MKDFEHYTLTLTRNEMCRLMSACTHIVIDHQMEYNDPETTEGRKKVITGTIKMWQGIHDKVEAQIDEQDKQ